MSRALILAIAMSASVSSTTPAAYPPSEKKPASDEYHGVKVVDEYRWLEEAGSPAVQAWTEAQNKSTRAFLDALLLWSGAVALAAFDALGPQNGPVVVVASGGNIDRDRFIEILRG